MSGVVSFVGAGARIDEEMGSVSPRDFSKMIFGCSQLRVIMGRRRRQITS